MALDFRLLGPLEVLSDGRPLGLGGPRRRGVLALLLLRANRVVPVEDLADALYDGIPPASAVTQIQRQVSDLRSLLGPTSIETRPPGYLIRVAPGELDLDRFERTVRLAREAVLGGDHRAGIALFDDALALWRGPAIADLASEPFARVAAERLEEVRLAAVEELLDAELGAGDAAPLVPRLRALVDEHPFRERLRGRLMVALYRAGRQPDALVAFRAGRDLLVEEFGLEPSPELRALEAAILRQDPSLALDAAPVRDLPAIEADRLILVAEVAGSRMPDLDALAATLARGGAGEPMLLNVCGDAADLPAAVAAARTRGAALDGVGVRNRVAAFASSRPGRDIARLAAAHEVTVILVAAPPAIAAEGAVPEELAELFERAPCDVAVLAGGAGRGKGTCVAVPFGGGEHDWAAAAIAALQAAGSGASLRLVGTRTRGGADASRLMASASLAIQRLVRIEVDPVVAEPDERALTAAVADAALTVVGVSPRWKHDGIGTTRHALVRASDAPVLLVHRGPRPSCLAPREAMTRFTWSVVADDPP